MGKTYQHALYSVRMATDPAIKAEYQREADTILQRLAERLVQNEVVYCVSALVSTLAAREWDGSDGIDPDDLAALSCRQPDADDYREAARDAGFWDCPISLAHDGRRIDVAKDAFGVWSFTATDADGNEEDRGTGYDGTEVGAWRAAFDSAGIDHPDGAEVYEHWIVSDFLADALAERGESVVKDLAGLTIWGRPTTGQSIALDHVIQQIALATYGAED